MIDGFEWMLEAVLGGRCDEETRHRFEALIRDDLRAREAYLEQVRVHALLEWRHGGVAPAVERRATDPARMRPARWRRWGLAAIFIVGCGTSLLMAWRLSGHVYGVATLLEARDVTWGVGVSPILVNARLSNQAVHCESGVLRLGFDSGALVTLEGPADLQILSTNRLRALRGRITARASGDAKGFAIETPSSLVIDRGTEFGVEVDAAGRTGVVVFEGLVDLLRADPGKEPAEVKHLARGEALRVEPGGALRRIIAVERHPGGGWSTGPSPERDAVIGSVSDNIRGLDSSKYYQVVYRGLVDDAPAYVDRPHEWNGLDEGGLPSFLKGADYVMTFNDDKWSSELEITVEVARASTLYVFLDNRERPPAAWLVERFVDSGVDIGLDEGSWPDPTKFSAAKGPGRSINQVFSVWSRPVEAGESIKLGSLSGGKNNRAMYGIAAVARP